MATDAGRRRVKGLTMAHGERVIQQGLDFAVCAAGKIHNVMGGSGCGKSTLLRHDQGYKAAGDPEKHPARGADLNDADRRNALRAAGA